jgi:hypothetical protein
MKSDEEDQIMKPLFASKTLENCSTLLNAPRKINLRRSSDGISEKELRSFMFCR